MASIVCSDSKMCGAEKREVRKPWGSGWIIWRCTKPKWHKKKEHVANGGKVRWKDSP